ncbi:cytochrome c3 family protein, partial [Thermodesulfobacteriota bacterium]
MSAEKGRKLLVMVMLTVILCVSGHFLNEQVFADHSDGANCLTCHSLKTSATIQNTSSVKQTAALSLGGTRLCEACHTGVGGEFVSTASNISRHPVQVAGQESAAPWPGGFLSSHPDASPYQAAAPGNSIECWNCHNANHLTNEGPDNGPPGTKRGYPDHNNDVAGDAPQSATPPWDYNVYHLYGPEQGDDIGGAAINYNSSNFQFCFTGTNVENIAGASVSIYNPFPSATSVPGCHGTDTTGHGTPTIVDQTASPQSIEFYYSVGHAVKGSVRSNYPGAQPAVGSKIACFTCHDPHSGGTNIRLFKIGTGNLTTVEDLCRECHGANGTGNTPTVGAAVRIYTDGDGDDAGVLVSPMSPPSSILAHGDGTPCFGCHNAHSPAPNRDGDCDMCHMSGNNISSNDDDELLDGNTLTPVIGITPKIDKDQWEMGGHGSTVGLPWNTAEPPPGLEVACIDGVQNRGNAGDPQMYNGCHDPTVRHQRDDIVGNPDNPYRLRGYNTNGAIPAQKYNITEPAPGEDNATARMKGPDAVCFRTDATVSACHEGDLLNANDNAIPHRHNRGNGYVNGKCMDCHDPHGDSSRTDGALAGITDSLSTTGSGVNWVMLQTQPTHTDRWSTTATGAFGDAVTLNKRDTGIGIVRYTGQRTEMEKNDNVVGSPQGICEICHRNGAPKHFQFEDADGGTETGHMGNIGLAASENCTTTCHPHGKRFTPPSKCVGCHASAMNATNAVGTDLLPARPAIVYQDGAGNFHLRDLSTETGGIGGMSRHGINGAINDTECVVCHMEGNLVYNAGSSEYSVELNATYHIQEEGQAIDLRNMADGLLLMSYTPTDTTPADGYDDNAVGLNASFCGGCHDTDGAEFWPGYVTAAGGPASGSAAAPWNNSGMILNNSSVPKETGGTDNTTPPDMWTQYSQTGSANYSKYSTGTYNVVPQLMKSYSPHGDPATNITKGEHAGELPGSNAFVSTAVACMHCHTAHASNIVADGVRGTIPAAGNYGNFPSTNQSAMTRLPEPELCWNCHDAAVANVWDFYGDTVRSGGNSPLQWGTTPLGAGVADGVWSRDPASPFAYKEAPISSIHGIKGYQRPRAAPAVSANVPAEGRVVCSVCHDPHGIDLVNGAGYDDFLLPILRAGFTSKWAGGDTGGWLTSPYKEDRPGKMNGAQPQDLACYMSSTRDGTATCDPGRWDSGMDYATWIASIGPRTEPLDRGTAAGFSVTLAAFAYNNPTYTGGGYGAQAPTNGNDGYFLNDNTFGTNGGFLTSGATRAPVTRYEPISLNANTANNTEGIPTIAEREIGGFCRNCHDSYTIDDYGDWTGHGSVYGGTVRNDLFTSILAVFPHGGPYDTGQADNLWMVGRSQGLGAANGGSKWATVQGITGGDAGGAQINAQTTQGWKVNYHEFTCSKCHTPHASVINKLMRTNCLSGGTDSQNTNMPDQPSWINTSTDARFGTGMNETGNFIGNGTATPSGGNRAGFAWPAQPAASNFGEAFTMHCHNSEVFAAGNVTLGSSNWVNTLTGNTTFFNTSAWDGTGHKYSGGWQNLDPSIIILPPPGNECGSQCHANPNNVAIDSGAHQKHLNGAATNGVSLDCQNCHYVATGYTSSPWLNPRTEFHQDPTINFADSDWAGTTETTLFATSAPAGQLGNGTSATTVCDGCHTAIGAATDAKNNWNTGTSLPCTSCHNSGTIAITTYSANTAGAGPNYGGAQAANALGDSPLNDFTTAVGTYGYYITGHGLPKSSQYVSTDPGAGFKGDGRSGCLTCHDANAAHLDSNAQQGSSGFRFNASFITIDAGKGVVYNVCMNCHKSTGQTIPAFDGNPAFVGNVAAANTSNWVGNHDIPSMQVTDPGYTATNTWNFTPDCQNCHDPHGSTFNRTSMVGTAHNGTNPTPTEVYITTADAYTNANNNQRINDSLKLAYDAAQPAGAKQGPCHACHTQTLHDRNTDTATHENDNPPNDTCTGCHTHYSGFKPSPCDGCHGYPPGYDFSPLDAASKVGSLETNNLTAVEAGAHSLHTYRFTNSRDNDGAQIELVADRGARPGYPKLDPDLKAGGTCRLTCHTSPDHKTVDDATAEVEFDVLYDGVGVANAYQPGDPIITKNQTVGVNYGDASTTG